MSSNRSDNSLIESKVDLVVVICLKSGIAIRSHGFVELVIHCGPIIPLHMFWTMDVFLILFWSVGNDAFWSHSYNMVKSACKASVHIRSSV